MSNELEGQEQAIEVDGQKVSLDELKAGYMKGSDYTRKTQALATQQTQFHKDKADLADVQAKLNLIKAQPGAEAVFDHLIKHPEAIGQMLTPGQPQAQPQATQELPDPFATPVVPQGQPQANQGWQQPVAALAGVTQELIQNVNEGRRNQAINAVREELARSWKDRPWLDEELVLADLNASPHLWNSTASEQLGAILHKHYGAQIVADAKAEGRADAQRDYEAQRETDEKAANTPTAATMPDGSAIPTDPRELARLMNEDLPKYQEAMTAIKRKLDADRATHLAHAEELASL